MKTIYLAIAREDTGETSAKVVGMYSSVEDAKADLAKRFSDLRDKIENEFLWQEQKYTCKDVKAVAYFHGDVPLVGWGTERHEIVILEQKVNV